MIQNRELGDSKKKALMHCDSDGDSELMFRDSTLLQFDLLCLLLAAEFLTIPGL